MTQLPYNKVFFIGSVITLIYILMVLSKSNVTLSVIDPMPLSETYVVDTPGCKIPYLDPYDSSATPYIYVETPAICGLPLILSDQFSIWVDEKLKKTLKYGTNLECCYESFERQHFDVDKGEVQDRWIKMSGKCTPFKDRANIYDEFIEVRCKVNGSEVYKDYHAFIVRKRPTEAVPVDPTQKPSVIVIGIDAVSRANFARQMKQTKSFLLQEKAIEFLGYNKVAENTFPNILPMFTGYHVEELEKTCLQDKKKFDKCHYIWQDFAKNGYLSAFAEDTCNIGLFLYLKKGFFKQPTDYYSQAFMKMNEDKIGNYWKGNAYVCLGSRVAIEVLNGYTEKLILNLTREHLPFFGHFWGTSLTHDYLNVPVQGDQLYVSLLNNLKQSGVFNSSIVIFMSDHGLRWGSFRSTYQGRLEDRLPFLFILVPEWFRKKYPTAVEHLQINTRRLVTTFDLHATLEDLVDITKLRESSISLRFPHMNQRGLSLFMPIPTSRNCVTAGITEEWCTCYESTNMTVEHSVAVTVAEALVVKLNTIVKDQKKCAKLKLEKILTARMATAQNDGSTLDSSKQRIFVMVSVEPGGGHFEGHVIYDGTSKTAVEDGYISRINAYGNSSICVEDTFLRQYCFCK